MEPAGGETASDGRVNDARASTSLTRLESSALPVGTTMAKPPGVFLNRLLEYGAMPLDLRRWQNLP